MNSLAKSTFAAALTGLLTASATAAPALGPGNVKCSGISETRALEEATFDHNLKIVFADETGAYLGDASAEILKGDVMLAHIECPGPWVMAELPPGDYMVKAEFNGEVKRVKVSVDDGAVLERTVIY